MKNLPTRIFLQVGEEVDKDTDFNELHGVTWWSDRVFDTDIEYVIRPRTGRKRKTVAYPSSPNLKLNSSK